MAISLHTVLASSPRYSYSTDALPRYDLPSAPSSLAILGPLPRSSAVHIALGLLAKNQYGNSHDKDSFDDSVLILSKSENEWSSALVEDGDLWFETEAGRAGLSKMLDRVNIRYAPTATHLAFLLSLLSTDGALISDPTRLESIPRLIILHELSSFFGGLTKQDGEDKLEWRPRTTVDQSQYGSLLTLALSTVEMLNKRRPSNIPPTQLLLLDSHGSSISLPIVLPPAGRNSSESDLFAPSKRMKDVYPKLDIRVLVEKFIDWVGIVQPSEPIPASVEQRSNPRIHRVIVPSLSPNSTAPAESRANISTDVDIFWFCEERIRTRDRDTKDRRDTENSPYGAWIWCKEP